MIVSHARREMYERWDRELEADAELRIYPRMEAAYAAGREAAIAGTPCRCPPVYQEFHGAWVAGYRSGRARL